MKLIQIIKLLLIKIVTCSSNDQVYENLKTISQGHDAPPESFEILELKYDKISEMNLEKYILMIMNWFHIFSIIFVVVFILFSLFDIIKSLEFLSLNNSILPGLSCLSTLIYGFFYELKFLERSFFDGVNFNSFSVFSLSIIFYSILSFYICWIMCLKTYKIRLFLFLIGIYILILMLTFIILATGSIYSHYFLISLSLLHYLLSLLLFYLIIIKEVHLKFERLPINELI